MVTINLFTYKLSLKKVLHVIKWAHHNKLTIDQNQSCQYNGSNKKQTSNKSNKKQEIYNITESWKANSKTFYFLCFLSLMRQICCSQSNKIFISWSQKNKKISMSFSQEIKAIMILHFRLGFPIYCRGALLIYK